MVPVVHCTCFSINPGFYECLNFVPIRLVIYSSWNDTSIYSFLICFYFDGWTFWQGWPFWDCTFLNYEFSKASSSLLISSLSFSECTCFWFILGSCSLHVGVFFLSWSSFSCKIWIIFKDIIWIQFLRLVWVVMRKIYLIKHYSTNSLVLTKFHRLFVNNLNHAK